MRLGLFASAFDPFPHPGHLWAIQQALAAGACDAILAALQEDPSLERPSKRRPALSVEERTQLLLACRYVHAVVPYRTEHDLMEIMGTGGQQFASWARTTATTATRAMT